MDQERFRTLTRGVRRPPGSAATRRKRHARFDLACGKPVGRAAEAARPRRSGFVKGLDRGQRGAVD